MTKPSFLVSCSFAAQRSRARALPLLNLKKKRGCSQSRVQRYSLTFPQQKQVISCLICGTKWNKKRQNKTLCQVHLTLSKTETFRTGTNCPSQRDVCLIQRVKIKGGKKGRDQLQMSVLQRCPLRESTVHSSHGTDKLTMYRTMEKCGIKQEGLASGRCYKANPSILVLVSLRLNIPCVRHAEVYYFLSFSHVENSRKQVKEERKTLLEKAMELHISGQRIENLGQGRGVQVFLHYNNTICFSPFLPQALQLETER